MEEEQPVGSSDAIVYVDYSTVKSGQSSTPTELQLRGTKQHELLCKAKALEEELHLLQEKRLMEQAACSETMRQMEATLIDEKEARRHAELAAERLCVESARAVDAVHHEWTEYKQAAEERLIRAALEIARAILHYESSIDPLFLAGAVKIVMNAVAEDMEIVLRVSPQDVDLWLTKAVSGMRHCKVEGDASLTRGSCLLVSAFGRNELNVERQIEEMRSRLLHSIGATSTDCRADR